MSTIKRVPNFIWGIIIASIIFSLIASRFAPVDDGIVKKVVQHPDGSVTMYSGNVAVTYRDYKLPDATYSSIILDYDPTTFCKMHNFVMGNGDCDE